MSDAEKKADEKADENEASPTIIYKIEGDFIHGDKTSVGDVINSKGIAVGTGASAEVSKGSTPAPATGAGPGSGGHELDSRALYKLIVDQFNIEEIKELCFELGVDFEDLGGSGKKGKARELVTYMERRGRLGELYAAISQARS